MESLKCEVYGVMDRLGSWDEHVAAMAAEGERTEKLAGDVVAALEE